MNSVASKKMRERQSASQSSARHSGAGGDPPASSFRTPRSGDPESSSLPSIVEERVDGVRTQTAMPWRIVRLGDVAKTLSGGTPKRSVSSYYDGDIPWVKSGELGDRVVYETGEKISRAALEQSSAKLFPKGTLCVALYGATVGKLGILGIEAATNQAVCGIFLPESIDTRFAYRFLESKRRELIEKGKGGAQPNISQEIIRDLEFPLPPIDVQRQIVSEIEKQFTRLDAGMAALRRVQANLKRYRAAVLKAACEGRLVPTEAELAKAEGRTFETGEQLLARILADRRKNWHGRGKYKEPAVPDTTNLPPLPEGWAWASLDQLLELMRNGISVKPDGASGLPILRISAVRTLSVNLEDIRYLKARASDYPDYVLAAGDLLFTRYNGNADLVGVCGVVPTHELPLVHPDKLIRCRLVASRALPQFVAMMANVGASRDYLARRVRTTAGQAGISGGDLKGQPIPVPPAAEQSRIVAEVERRLSVMEEVEAAVNADLRRAWRLRSSILRQAFSN
ncbi:MAG: hypothetical protein EPN36_12070 [Rhodanobacteraceae bacterium]|nr:MAG: hypothetical protein EPN36_12070 [Rhodanobacteraceae bacterium]